MFRLVIFFFTLLFPVLSLASANDSLLQLAIKHLDAQHNDWARSVIQELEKHVNKDHPNRDLADYLSVRSSLEGRYANYALQFDLVNQFYDVAVQLEDPKLIAKANIAFSSYYEQFGDLKKALPFYLKALDQFIILHQESDIAYLYNKLGVIYYSDGDYKLAQTYFFGSYTLFYKHKEEDIVNAYWVQNCLSNIGLCYLRMNNPRKALAYMKMALEYSKIGPFKRDRPIAVNNTQVGVVYGRLGKYKEAIAYLNEGIKACMLPENGEEEHGIESIINLAEVYTQMRDYKEANIQLNKVLSYLSAGKASQLWGYYFEKLGKLKLLEKDFKSAYLAQQSAAQFNDSVDQALEKSIYSRQILMHSLEKQKMENVILKAENDYKTLMNEVIVAVVALFLIIAILSYQSLKKSKARNLELESLNKKITDQKLSLEELNQKLERINQNKSYLIQSIAHDLRTPIGNVLSLNSLMEDQLEQGSENADYSALIHSSCLLSLNIIEDILDQSMIERGKLQLKFSEVNLHEVINECIALLQFKYTPKNIRLNTYFGEALLLEADEDRIKRVFLNILMNAIKFSPRNTEIQIKQSIEKNKYVVAIKDQGIGMDESVLSQIFDKHTNAGREGLDKEKTIGIGLSIARSIVEEHGGKIKVESKPDSGSTFYIELPLIART